MNNMSDKTIQILKEAGWYENRNIDIENLVRFLSERGFEVFPSVKKFLKEFGMLNIKVPTNATDEYIERHNFRKYDGHKTDIYSALGDAVDVEFMIIKFIFRGIHHLLK